MFWQTLLAVGVTLVFLALTLWDSHRTGNASVGVVFQFNRRKNPIGFWVIQAALAAVIIIGVLWVASMVVWGNRPAE